VLRNQFDSLSVTHGKGEANVYAFAVCATAEETSNGNVPAYNRTQEDRAQEDRAQEDGSQIGSPEVGPQISDAATGDARSVELVVLDLRVATTAPPARQICARPRQR
jgi:hypothetical protein